MSLLQSLYRSVLFVPGSKQNHIAKSANIAADGLIFDLEDAVPMAGKLSARKMVVKALSAPEFSGRKLIVRVNATDTPWFVEDVQTIVGVGNCAIMLPKCESVEDIFKLKALTKSLSMRIFVLIETALGVLSVSEIAKELTSSDALCFGHVDFMANMALPDSSVVSSMVHHARCQVALAARAYGITPIDHVCLDVSNEASIRDEALAGLNLGYAGKMCIHPDQVAVINAVYTPSKDQFDRAEAILNARDDAKQKGKEVFSFENKMVDLPVIRAQENILMRYKASIKAGGI